MLFVNTRPSDRAAALSAALSQHQVNVFELPLLELQAVPYHQELAALYQQLYTSQVIVVVSPTAVEIGMQYLAQSGVRLSDLAHVRWVAVGVKTAEVLAKYGIEAAIPTVETSEGMLQLPSLHQLAQGSCIAFWRGVGGREFMMQQLQDAGMQILNFVLYQRHCPENASERMQELRVKITQHSRYIVLISSEASFKNWLDIFQEHPDIIKNAQYMVLGSRLTELVQHYQAQHQIYTDVLQVLQLTPRTVLAHLHRDTGKA